MADETNTEPIRLNKTSLSDQAAEALRRMVLRSALPPGSTLTERGISEMLGVSRTPVREAVRILINEGLIINSDTGRLSVVNPDNVTVINLAHILKALEGLACDLAVTHAKDADIARISEENKAMKELADDVSEFSYFDRDIAFHRMIVAASRNRQLVQMHKIVDDQLYQARHRASCNVMNRNRAVEEHDTIIKALIARNRSAARRAINTHLHTSISNLGSLLSGSEPRSQNLESPIGDQ